VTTTGRDLYIVSPERTELFELLRKRLGDGDTAEVILDRRRGERGTPWEGTWEERRSGERRYYYDDAHLLRTIGVIRVSRDRLHTPPQVLDSPPFERRLRRRNRSGGRHRKGGGAPLRGS